LSEIEGAMQYWVTIAGNNAYVIRFISTPETFDSPEKTQIRDDLIKSIKFLSANNLTDGNIYDRVTNRTTNFPDPNLTQFNINGTSDSNYPEELYDECVSVVGKEFCDSLFKK
jgi:hypothetical protein